MASSAVERHCASPPPISPHFVPTNDLARVLFLYFVSPACFCLPTIMRSFQGERGGRGRRARRETTLPSLPPHPASCFLARKNIFVLLNRCSLNDKWLATANPSATTISPRTLTWCLPISIASTSFFTIFSPKGFVCDVSFLCNLANASRQMGERNFETSRLTFLESIFVVKR